MDVGFTLGAIFEYLKGDESSFFQDGRIGVSYRSGITHDLSGPAQFRGVPTISAPGAPAQFPHSNAFQNLFFDQGASAELNLPEIYHFSLYQRFAHQFGIMGDIAWTRWSRLQNITIEFENAVTPSSALNLGYKNALRYAVGLEWYATKNLTPRLGFGRFRPRLRVASRHESKAKNPRGRGTDSPFVAVFSDGSTYHYEDNKERKR